MHAARGANGSTLHHGVDVACPLSSEKREREEEVVSLYNTIIVDFGKGKKLPLCQHKMSQQGPNLIATIWPLSQKQPTLSCCADMSPTYWRGISD
jgi:hypothetical protein